MKLSESGTSSVLGSTRGHSTTGGATGGGKYLRRLETMENCLTQCQNKCAVLEERCRSLERWKGAVEKWLVDFFGEDARLPFGDEGSEPNSGLPHPPDANGMDVPLIVPKHEEGEETEDSEAGNETNTEEVVEDIVEQGDGEVAGSNNVENFDKADGNNETLPLQPGSDHNHLGDSQKTVACSSEANNKSTPTKNVVVGDNLEAAVNKSSVIHLSSNLTVEVEKVDALESNTNTKEPNTKVLRSGSPRRPVILAGDKREGNEDDNEISIIFASPGVSSVKETSRILPKNLYPAIENFEMGISDMDADNDEVPIDIPATVAVADTDEQDPFEMAFEDDPTPCSVCTGKEPNPRNEMIFCDQCNVCVHQQCYGVTVIPMGGWKCTPCSQGLDTKITPCYFCPELGGALKKVRSPSQKYWSHVSCALWIPEVKIENLTAMEPIINVSKIPASRWNLKCSLCKKAKIGACIQCQFNTRCSTAFHVTCAIKHGLEMKEEVSECMAVLKAYCKSHTYRDQKKKDPKKKRRNHSAKRSSPNKKQRTQGGEQTHT